MLNLLVIGLGGFLGAIFRALLSSFATKIAPQSSTLGTLLVNVLGSFLIARFLPTRKTKAFRRFLKALLARVFWAH